MKILAVVPARGGSKGIPMKNMAKVGGLPLIEWTLRAAKGCSLISWITVSTDHPEIANYARDSGVSVTERPPDLAADSAPTLPVVKHAWDRACARGEVADVVLTLQPTSPLREATHLTAAIELFRANPEADSLVSVQRVPHQFAPDSLMEVEGVWGVPIAKNSALRRQDKSKHWARNGAAIYLTRAVCLDRFVWGGKTLIYPMDKLSSVDVDDAEDLEMAHALLQNRIESARRH